MCKKYYFLYIEHGWIKLENHTSGEAWASQISTVVILCKEFAFFCIYPLNIFDKTSLITSTKNGFWASASSQERMSSSLKS